MADTGDYECRLLADLLPTCLAVADFFAGSSDVIAVAARADTDAFTFYQNLYYEFCRLQAGQIVTYDGSLTVLGVGVTPLLQMLESRTARVCKPLSVFEIRAMSQAITMRWLRISQLTVLCMILCVCTAFLIYKFYFSIKSLTLDFSHLYVQHGYVKAPSRDWRLYDPWLWNGRRV